MQKYLVEAIDLQRARAQMTHQLSKSARHKHNNYRKHETENRHSCDVIQESAGTTASQKNTVARMMRHSNCMQIDFHSLTPEA